ncbi:MAG: fumarylacetoacetate hydrolase [Rheinheimera sp.]|nr:fumarylacetoacetate hydrolase [Rheinheimera sp.]|tara:strand:+ start:769 stop:1719 length:951 start_codon:yes stop_codon:yes gene_type:complete
MKLATIKTQTPDGQLVLISEDLQHFVSVCDIAPSLQEALNSWSNIENQLKQRYQALNSLNLENIIPIENGQFMAPLPRCWQWLDGSLFLNHGILMQQAFHLDPIADADIHPLVYQGAGDSFIASTEVITAPSEQVGIDFEGEFGVIVDEIPMGSSPEFALKQIRLIVMLNDISYRTLGPREMKTGFGFVQAKGQTTFAPIAITPDELGNNWHNGRITLPLEVYRNEKWFGAPDGSDMHFGFHELIAHVAKTRTIKAGTVLGSGTVSNEDPSKGQACISELRAKEMIATGKPQTEFLKSGETVRMQVLDQQGKTVFG